MPRLLMLYKKCFADFRWTWRTEIILLITSLVETLSSLSTSSGIKLSSFTQTGSTLAFISLSTCTSTKGLNSYTCSHLKSDKLDDEIL